MVRIPVISQSSPLATDSGLACLAMIASYFGRSTTLSSLLSDPEVETVVLTSSDITRAAHRLGISGRAVRVSHGNFSGVRMPCILHLTEKKCVVVRSVGRRFAYVNDPAGELQTVDIALLRMITCLVTELWPSPDFVKATKVPGVSIRQMLSSIIGLRKAAVQVGFLAISLEVFAMASPLFLQWVINNVETTQDDLLLAVSATGFAAILLLQYTLMGLRSHALIHIGATVGILWRTHLFSHLIRLPLGFFSKRQLGDVVSRFNSVDEIQNTITASVVASLLDGAMSIVTLQVMLLYSPVLTAIVVSTSILYALGKKLAFDQRMSAKFSELNADAMQQTHFMESIRGIRTIKLFQREDVRQTLWLGDMVDAVNAKVRGQKNEAFFACFNGFLIGIGSLGVIWVGVREVTIGNLSLGALVAFLAYKGIYDVRTNGCIDRINALQLLGAAKDRLALIVNTEKEETRAVARSNDSANPSSVHLRNVRFRYSPDSAYVLNGVDLEILAGQSIAITGASGCGKTTLLSILAGLVDPYDGEILIGGLPVRALGQQKVRSLIGAVMQDDVLFAGTISQNISFFDKSPSQEWIESCAKSASVHDEIMQMTRSYQTLIGEMGTSLSGGQKQRLLLARALYKRPRILLLDEATSHLDANCERRVNEAIGSLKLTRIIVAHRQETIRSADRIVRIVAGKVVEDTKSSVLRLEPV